MHSESRVTSEAPNSAEVVGTPGAPKGPSTYREVLAALVGRTVQIVNPESYEEGAMGTRLTANFYRGKIVSLGEDFIKVQTILKKSKTGESDEPVSQYIPLARVKRISTMKTNILLHI